MARLAVLYSALREAVQATEAQKNELIGLLRNINSSVDNLGATFKGKAGRAFLGWWTGIGTRHSEAIIKQIEVLDRKLDQIAQKVADTDTETAGYFTKS